MYEALDLAGFFAAHAVWSVSEGGPLIPIVAFQLADGSRKAIRFMGETLEASVAQGKEELESNPDGAIYAVLVYDGFVALDDGRTDALLLEVRSNIEPVYSVLIAIPYRPKTRPKGVAIFRSKSSFAVFRPKFLSVEGVDVPDSTPLADAFFGGVDSHEKGAAVWNAHLDESR